MAKEDEGDTDLPADDISETDTPPLELEEVELVPSEPKAMSKQSDTDSEPTASALADNHIDLSESQPLSASPRISPAAETSTTGQSSDAQANKRLIVGQGIRLSGEINSCDRLVVEGEVEVTLNDTLALEITSSGKFTGGCEVEEADISGIYEGDLTVRNTLFVRGSGRITGTIRYGQLELERGGQIAGNISVLGNESTASNDIARAKIAKAPLFGEGKSS
ncbi:MAG: bactofilin family protein [Geminicoccales bacterium]